MPIDPIYRVIFHNQDKVYEVYARSVSQDGMFGFVEVEELLFGQRSEVVVDPSEESLRAEFKGVNRIHVPMHAVIRVDEVEKQGVSRVSDAGKDGTLSFPTPVYSPGAKKD